MNDGLSGALPAALGGLSSLAFVDLGGNMLSGRLPDPLPASLHSIRLSGNFLTGTIPASYGAGSHTHTVHTTVQTVKKSLSQHWCMCCSPRVCAPLLCVPSFLTTTVVAESWIQI